MNGVFIWDDDVMLKNNPYVQSPSGLYDIWCTTRLPDFFPLTSTSLWLEFWMWGLDPTPYHITNLLLHIASALLLWRILLRLGIPGAWLAAVVFAIHPVNVESVAWITQRKNTLAMVFYLAAILFYLRSLSEVRGSRFEVQGSRFSWHYRFSLFAFLLALLAKTSVVMLPFVLLLCHWWLQTSPSRSLTYSLAHLLTYFRRTVPFFALSLILGLVTVWFQNQRAIAGDVVQSAGFFARLAGAGWGIWFYLVKALLPLKLSFVYPRWEIDPHSLLSYLPLAALIILVFVVWRYRRGWGRPVLFALGYFVLMLAPVLGFLTIYFQRYSLVADHWQYFSIIGPIALVVGAVAHLIVSTGTLKRGHPTLWFGVHALACLAVAALVVLTWRQSALYKNSETIWTDTLRKNPGCWMAHNNLGLCFGNTAEAMKHFEDSLRLYPEQVEAHLNLGAVLMKLGHLDDAKAQFESARANNPSNGMAYFNLGLVLEEQGKTAEAQACYRRAIKLWPHYAEAHSNLGASLQVEGNLAEAQAQFVEALRLQPSLISARNNLGLALQAQGKTAEAIAQFMEALRLQPKNPQAHNNLGKTYAEQRRLSDALGEMNEAVRLNPAYTEALLNLSRLHYEAGNVLMNQHKIGEAEAHYRFALQVQTNYPEAHYQLAVIAQGRNQTGDAIAHFRDAARLKPDWVEALNNLAWMLATCPDARNRDGSEAVRLATHAVELTRTNNAGALDTLAAAYAEAGRFPDASRTAQHAAELAKANKDMAADIQKRRQLYDSGRPFREEFGPKPN
jgi:tetratricopeptide (TPR) repeat protein